MLYVLSESEAQMLKLSAVLALLALALLFLSVAPGAASPATGPEAVARGRALFLAKGCASCHEHAAVAGSRSPMNAPTLTHYRPNPEFVRRWLHNPAAIRPGTPMPNLGLHDDEIEALIAFLAANAR